MRWMNQWQIQVVNEWFSHDGQIGVIIMKSKVIWHYKRKHAMVERYHCAELNYIELQKLPSCRKGC